MARSMIVANHALFSHLDEHCARRGEPIPSAGADRWVRGDTVAEDWLKHLKLRETLRFGRRRFLTWLSCGDSSVICLVGFEFEVDIEELASCESNAGISVFLLSELKPLPTATPAQIRNIVEVGSRSEPGYTGHDPESLEGLFPSIWTFEPTGVLDDESAARLFLIVCINECRNGESWIGDELAADLVSLAHLSLGRFPYGALCRSIFDSDPRALYMALYRCLEATYAYESCRKLISALGLSQDWYRLASALDEEVGWHPQHAASLNLVLRYAVEGDLRTLCDRLHEDEGAELNVRAGRAIYRLRNGIVHYTTRPGDIQLTYDDWNGVCRAMVGIVVHVFYRAYETVS